jgi:hypothetical protein
MQAHWLLPRCSFPPDTLPTHPRSRNLNCASMCSPARPADHKPAFRLGRPDAKKLYRVQPEQEPQNPSIEIPAHFPESPILRVVFPPVLALVPGGISSFGWLTATFPLPLMAVTRAYPASFKRSSCVGSRCMHKSVLRAGMSYLQKRVAPVCSQLLKLRRQAPRPSLMRLAMLSRKQVLWLCSFRTCTLRAQLHSAKSAAARATSPPRQ